MCVEEEIKKLFFIDCLSIAKIAEKLGLNINQVYKIVYKNNWKRTKEQKTKCRQRTCLEKYGCTNISQRQEIKEKKKQKSLEKYGTENVFQSQTVKEKYKQTCLKKYGVENVFQNKDIQNKQRQTLQQKYNVTNSFQLVDQQKQWQTLNNQKTKEKRKNTNKQKYGNNYLFGSEYFKNKVKQTWLQKYGVDNPMKDNTIKQKITNNLPKALKKAHETKKKNKSYGKSKQEDYIYSLLINKFDHVERQYSSDLYPFACDFYVPDLDLYIEYQGNWTHGGIAFDSSQLQKLNIWKEKAKTSKYYQNAIYVWTVSDVEKRNFVKKHRLNWIEFFNLQQFERWYYGF